MRNWKFFLREGGGGGGGGGTEVSFATAWCESVFRLYDVKNVNEESTDRCYVLLTWGPQGARLYY